MDNKIKKPNKAEQLTYKALTRAIADNRLLLYLDYGRINRPGSPVYNPWENLLPVLTPIILGLILIMTTGVIFGLLFIIAALIIYTSCYKKKLGHRLLERTKAYMTSNYQNCQNIWNFGGIVLVNANNKKYGCVSPDNDWKEFIIQHFADDMTDNNNHKTETFTNKKTNDKPEETTSKSA